MKCVTDNCTYSCDEPCELEPYGDIAGLGVLLGFLITAYLVVALLLGHYVLIYDPSLDPFRPITDAETSVQYPNLADEIITGLARTIAMFDLRRMSSQAKGSKFEATVNKCVLLFADIQIITGIAILISGFYTLRCGLSSYHWQLIVYLAWFSSITHLSALTFLRHHFHNHRTERLFRVLGMSTMLILLCFAMIPTAHFVWVGQEVGASPNNHAACYYWKTPDVKTVAFQSFLISIFLLAYGYFTRMGKMSPRFTTAARRIIGKLKEKEKSAFENWQPNASGSWKQVLKSIVLEPLWVALLRCVLVQVDSFTSMFAEVYWLFFSAIWGSTRIFHVRTYSPGGENTWAFGQILPLILLAAPILSVVENFVEYKSSQIPATLDQVHELAQIATPQFPGRYSTNNERQDRASRSLPTYDSSYSGTLFLTVWYYIGTSLYIVVTGPTSIGDLALGLSFQILLFQPILQLTWILWCLWLKKIQTATTIASSLRFLVFFALFSMSCFQFTAGRGIPLRASTSSVMIASLVAAYILFLAWLVVELGARHRREIQGPAGDICNHYLPQLFASILLLVGPTVYLTRPGTGGSEASPLLSIGIFIGVSLFFQVFWIISQEWIQRFSVSERRRKQVQVFSSLFLWVLIVLWSWLGIGILYIDALGVPFLLLASFSLLSIGWCVSKILWLVIKSRRDYHLSR